MSSVLSNRLCTVLTLLACAAPLQAANDPGPLSSYAPQLPSGYGEKLAAVDLEKARMSFMRKCSSCHDHERDGGHGKGPHLWNLFGRQAGTIPGFEFSVAMKASGQVWSYATLNYYLTNTERAVPGRAMNFRGMRREKDRVRMIAFLRTLNDNPPPLP